MNLKKTSLSGLTVANFVSLRQRPEVSPPELVAAVGRVACWREGIFTLKMGLLRVCIFILMAYKDAYDCVLSKNNIERSQYA